MWQPAQYSISQNLGADLATSRGTVAAASGTANVEGTWTNIGGVTSFAYEAISVSVGVGTPNTNNVFDIGIVNGSNIFIIAENLAASSPVASSGALAFNYYLPLHVPAGVQLAIRTMAGSASATTCDYTLTGHAAGLGGAPGFSRCIALHTLTAARGAAIDPGGSGNTKGTWTQINSSSPAVLAGLLGIIGCNNDTARVAAGRALIDIGIGASGAEATIYPNALICWSTVRDGPIGCPRIGPFASHVPVGARIVARAQSNITAAGDRTIDLSLYGLVQ